MNIGKGYIFKRIVGRPLTEDEQLINLKYIIDMKDRYSYEKTKRDK